MALFEAQLILPCPQREVFDFLLRPANVALISPPEQGLYFVDAPEIVSQGTRLKFRIQVFGQVQEGEHEITSIVDDTRIIESQVKGVLKSWVHDHLFETNSNGEVVVTDRIEFEPPGGVLGLLVTKNRVLDQLEDAFEHRYVRMKKLLAKK